MVHFFTQIVPSYFFTVTKRLVMIFFTVANYNYNYEQTN